MDEETKRGPGRPPKAAQAEPEPAMFRMRVMRDYWPEADQRVHAGTEIECTAAEAMDGVETGNLERVRD